MTRKTAYVKIEKYLSQRYGYGSSEFRVYGTDQFAGGYLVKLWREYEGLSKDSRLSEDRVLFFEPREAYPNELHCKFDMICR